MILKRRRKIFIFTETGEKCTQCGYSKYRGALEFHHLDKSQKDFSLSELVRRKASPIKLLEEIKKCVLLCANCHRKAHQKIPSTKNGVKHQKVKIQCVDYKGGKCVICGYSEIMDALEFHHIDGLEKDFTISKVTRFFDDKLKQELDKCVLVCANHHREVHAELVTIS